MFRNPSRSTSFALVSLLGIFVSAQAQNVPSGWAVSTRSGIQIYTPSDVPSDQSFEIAVYPATSLSGRDLSSWISNFAAHDILALANASPLGAVKSNSRGVASVSRVFYSKQGGKVAVVYTAVSRDGRTVRGFRTLSSDIRLILRYATPMQTLMASAIGSQAKILGKLPASGARGMTQEQPPKPTAGTLSGQLKLGGKFAPGIYRGVLYADDGDLLRRDNLYLFPNGEWGEPQTGKYAKKTGWENNGRYSYDQGTGKININGDFNNDDDEVCVFGHDAKGTTFIVQKASYSHYIKRITYSGPIDRLSPENQKISDAKAATEAARYKWVTTPGHGIKASQVAGAYFYSRTDVYYNFGVGANTVESVYLLLRDGTVHDGLKVPPDEMDVALSRRKEPKTWGHWKQVGGKILAIWPGQIKWNLLRGWKAFPGALGERINGRFVSARSGSNSMSGWYSFNGVTFSPNGSFKLDSRGGSGSSTLATTSMGTAIFTEHDDKGSAVSANTPGVSVNSMREKPRGTGKAGTYSVKGWVMTLHYDDGRVVRQPFLWTREKQGGLYFDVTEHVKSDGKD